MSLPRKKRKKEKKRRSNFGMMRGNYLVKLIFVIKLLSWRLYGCNGVK